MFPNRYWITGKVVGAAIHLPLRRSCIAWHNTDPMVFLAEKSSLPSAHTWLHVRYSVAVRVMAEISELARMLPPAALADVAGGDWGEIWRRGGGLCCFHWTNRVVKRFFPVAGVHAARWGQLRCAEDIAVPSGSLIVVSDSHHFYLCEHPSRIWMLAV